MLPGFGDDFSFALEEIVLIAHLVVLIIASAASSLGSRKLALERIGLDGGNIGARFGTRVLRHRIGLTTLPCTALKSSMERTVEPSASFATFCSSKLTVGSSNT